MVIPSPLLEAKLFIPRVRRGLVTRLRLSERLSRRGESKLTLVSAPAGFGKTTLVAEWLAATPLHERRAAWLSLDPSDNRAASFWPYVIAALQTVVPEVGATAISLLGSPQTPITSVLATLLNDLSGLPRDIVLVLDDYHVVDASDIQDGMAYLIEHLPPQLHLRGHHPRRPGIAARSLARAWRAHRDPRGGSALYARGGRRVPERGDGAGV